MRKASNREYAVAVRDLKKYYKLRTNFVDKILIKEQKYIKAVDDISLAITERKTFGLVGESGCGKSTLGRCVLRLEPLTGGNITIFEQNIYSLEEKELRRFRKRVQMVFQNPFNSLNPKLTVLHMLKEAGQQKLI